MKNIILLLLTLTSVMLASAQSTKKESDPKRNIPIANEVNRTNNKAKLENKQRDSVNNSSNKKNAIGQVIQDSETINSNTNNRGAGAKRAPGNTIINNPSGTVNGTKPDVKNGNGDGSTAGTKQPTP